MQGGAKECDAGVFRVLAPTQSPLPEELHDFSTEAFLAKLDSEGDAIAYANRVSEKEKTRLIKLGRQMKERKHSLLIFDYIQNNPLTESEHSRWLYYFLGALDFMGIEFD